MHLQKKEEFVKMKLSFLGAMAMVMVPSLLRSRPNTHTYKSIGSGNQCRTYLHLIVYACKYIGSNRRSRTQRITDSLFWMLFQPLDLGSITHLQYHVRD